MKIWICGASGHMGRVVLEQAKADGIEVIGGIDAMNDGTLPFPVYASFDEAPAAGDAIIDFSRPSTLDSLLRYAVANGLPCVLATTGYTEEQLAQIDEAAKSIPIFRSGNFSIGVALMRQLCKKAAQVLGRDFDVEIVEAHHHRKVDAPSGTALMLYEAVKEGEAEPSRLVSGRTGNDCKRQPGDIGIHSVRGGTVIGEHEVMFLGQMERISLSHSAESRSIFAIGAVKAAAWLQGKPAGLYNMDDLVG